MRALDVVLAYARLSSEEQGKVNELLTIISHERRALCILREQMMDHSGDIRTEMGAIPSDNEGKPSNVVHAVFGTSEKRQTRGRKPIPNGPTDLYRKFQNMNPSGPCRDFQKFALGISPNLTVKSLQMTYYKQRAKSKVA